MSLIFSLTMSDANTLMNQLGQITSSRLEAKLLASKQQIIDLYSLADNDIKSVTAGENANYNVITTC